jgi:Protein of unknown function (DUF1091)
MIRVQIFIFLIHFCTLVSTQRDATADDVKLRYFVKIRGIKCESFDNATAYPTICFAKAYSRKVTAINFGYSILKPLKKNLYVEISCNYRYGNVYREVISTKPLNWCSTVETVKLNPVMKLFINSMDTGMSKIIHKCPYEGNENFYNITIDQDKARKISIFPEGYYKFSIKTFSNVNQPIIFWHIFMEINSPLKDSFGR